MKAIRCKPPTDLARSELMRRVRQFGTKAEQEVADILHTLRLRFRQNVKTLPGSPDFANKRRGWVIFVHGCFWHRHPHCVRTTTPTRNRQFWLQKFAANKARDRQKARLLRSMGYLVITVWECETRNQIRLRRRFSRLISPT